MGSVSLNSDSLLLLGQRLLNHTQNSRILLLFLGSFYTFWAQVKRKVHVCHKHKSQPEEEDRDKKQTCAKQTNARKAHRPASSSLIEVIVMLKELKKHQGPVVQSVVSLTSSLRVISLTVLADSIHKIPIFFAEKMWVAFALTFFQQKISAYLRITRLKF